MTMIIDFADSFNMLPKGSRVLCAVSGGADSMCLLHFITKLAAERGLSVAAAHFNHKLRGAESDADEAFVLDYCKKTGIECLWGEGDVAGYARENGLGIEEAARELRYAFLERSAGEIGADRVATAHNADDNAETLLLNLTRGSGLRGLGGIPPVRGVFIRPLLRTSRREIEEYLSENGIPHVEDSTNSSDDYARNRLRRSVTPLLAELNPAFLQNVAHATEFMREDEEFISSLARDFIDKNMENKALPTAKLRELPKPVSARVFREAIGREVSAAHIGALRSLCESKNPSAELFLPGGSVHREYDRLVFSPPSREKIPRTELVPGEKVRLPGSGHEISCDILEGCEQVNNSFNIFFFSYSLVCGRMFARCRLEGEKVRLLGRNCTQSLKKLFSDAKIPKGERDLIPVLEDDLGIIGVYGFGISDRFSSRVSGRAIRVEINKK